MNQSGNKIGEVLEYLDQLIYHTPSHNHKADGMHRIVEQSTNLAMVTDLLELRLRASEKKRRKSERESEKKNANIKQLLIQLEQNQGILQQTISKCKQLEIQCYILNSERNKYKQYQTQVPEYQTQIDKLKKQNDYLRTKLEEKDSQKRAQATKYEQEIINLKTKRKLERNEWRLLYQQLSKQIKKLKKQMRIDNQTIAEENNFNHYQHSFR